MSGHFPVTTEPCTDSVSRPGGLLLQWHVTERCNQRCAHCYQEGYDGDELPWDGLMVILRQFIDLLTRWRQGGRVPGHITVTGGEPFVREDFLELLEVFAAHRRVFSFAILTNGTLIDARLARRLRRLRPAFVQVSVEGSQATHDRIRGPGSFQQTVTALKHLRRQGLRTLLSFSAQRRNFREFPEVARLGVELGVRRVWADRVIPWGRGAALTDDVLTPEETREFFQLMQSSRRQAQRHWCGRTEIAMHRALQFLAGGGQPYHCTAGDSLLAVQPNGDLLPCRRMPIRVGNLLQTPLAVLYEQSELLRTLRDPSRISPSCHGCAYARLCRGGLRCLAYALTGDPLSADPGCWHVARPRRSFPDCRMPAAS